MGRKANQKRRRGRRPFAKIIEILIAKAMKSVSEADMKATVADLFRARDLERELFPPKETVRNVRWIDLWDLESLGD